MITLTRINPFLFECRCDEPPAGFLLVGPPTHWGDYVYAALACVAQLALEQLRFTYETTLDDTSRHPCDSPGAS